MFKACRSLSIGLLLWGGSFSLASAAVFNVNTLADEVDNDTADGVCMTATAACSLRAAIQQANASAGADVIELVSGVYNFALVGDREELTLTGDLDIHSEITINGMGADQSVIDAMKLDRVFQVHSDGSLVLNEMTVRNGLVQFGGAGGGIDVSGGQLTVNDSNVTLNYSFGMGGGISNFNGSVVLNRTVIDQNISDAQGAGIFNQDGDFTINDCFISSNGGVRFLGGGIYNSAMRHLLEINNSTINGHTVQLDGGGIYHLLGDLKITNSTISNNSAGRNGGGLFIHNGNSRAGVTHELRSVTIANNAANGVDNDNPANGNGGGGLYVEGNIWLNTANTIFANSSAGNDCFFKGADAELGSLGHNLDTDGSCHLATDASSFSAAVAGLGPLVNNGGVTPTHALLANSDALDAGDDSLCPLVDQRGYIRPAGGCDIGAYEAEAVAPVVSFAAPPSNSGVSTDATNSAPIAFNQPLAVNAGGAIVGVFSASDVDGDSLSYQIVQPPTKGNVGRGRVELIPGEFEYAANADATGSDSFTFIACDSNVCSEPATISISFGSEPISGEMVVELAPGSSGVVSPVYVVAPENLDVTATDPDYSQPLGVFYFDVKDIPTAAGLENGIVVVIQLPSESVISPDAVIRKVNVQGIWKDLASEPDPIRSTGVIDPVAKTLTLSLVDNDEFDTNPEVGVIRDPVAVAVSKDVDPSVMDLPATVAVSVSEPEVVEESLQETDAGIDAETPLASADSSAGSEGGAALNPLVLALFGLLALLRRKPC